MSKSLLKIDVSDPKYKTREDSIQIRIGEEEVKVDFSKLVSQSKYVRDKYKYSEALESIQHDIDELEHKHNIKSEIIQHFIELVQEEKVEIPKENYKDFYTLSEYFCIEKIQHKLNDILREELLNDVEFTIQILQDSENSEQSEETNNKNKKIDTKLLINIENFLRTRINECLLNDKFKELPISTIYRILDGIDENDNSENKIDHNLLLDFILESATTRYILFKKIQLEEVEKNKIEEFYNFIETQDESTRNQYLEYMSFNLSFIKRITKQFEELLNKLNSEQTAHEQTKQNLKSEQINHEQTKAKLKQEQVEHEQTKQQLKSEQIEHEQTKAKLKTEQSEHEKAKEKLEQERIEQNQTKEKLKENLIDLEQTKQLFKSEQIQHEQTKQKLKQEQIDHEQTKQKLKHEKIKNDQSKHAIIVAGLNKDNQLGEKSNNKSQDNKPIISPPTKLTFDPSSLLSFSLYYDHTVLITNDRSLKGVGYNKDGRITASFSKTILDHFTEFSIKDRIGRKLEPISAVCSGGGTLYMFSKINDNGRQLVLCDYQINDGQPIFLDIGNHHPLALFAGRFHFAAICSEGEVIFINRDSVMKSPNSHIPAFSLPDDEKASSVACCQSSVIVLSSKGRVFSSPVEENNAIKFLAVDELKDKEIICLTGKYNHFLAVSKEGRVFGCGSNDYGKIGIGKGIGSVSSFTEISSLEGYKIRAAYAGCYHSLFETIEGKILSCGSNDSGELLLSSGPGEDVYLPTETTIKGGATFCIAGDSVSAIFIGIEPPTNTPNIRIQQHK